MSDRFDLLPAWAIEALRSPVRGRADARDRIMDRVRTAPMPSRTAAPAWGVGRPGMIRGSVGLAAAASLAAVLAGGIREHLATASATAGAATVVVLGDSIAGTLRDTLRLVRFVLDAPAASRVALAGDFTAWAPAALEREKQGKGRWSAVVALPQGRHAYAFVVDDTQRVGGPTVTLRRLTIAPDTRASGDSL